MAGEIRVTFFTSEQSGFLHSITHCVCLYRVARRNNTWQGTQHPDSTLTSYPEQSEEENTSVLIPIPICL